MKRSHRVRLGGATAVLLALPLMAGALPATAAPGGSPGVSSADTTLESGPAGRAKPLTVMTRNVYLGADIFRPLKAAETAVAAGKPLLEVLDAVAVANHDTKEIVRRTNFEVRARLLAKEIKQTKPDLVGLQEVALWRTGPFEAASLGVPNATTVDQDFLAILRSELRKRGLRYKVAVAGVRADVEAPAWDATGANRRDERLTMHDVILQRRGSGKVVRKGDRIFAENLPVNLAGIRMNFDRGYQWVDVKRGKQSFRFVNTHLESASSDLAFAQADEVVKKLVKPGRSTVMVCDCNSDPLNKSVKPADTVPHKKAYEHLTGAGGFTDLWLEWAPARKGWTSGLSETVDDTSAKDFDHRIDLVLARTPGKVSLRVVRGRMVGNRLKNRDRATGLWPSDHAGVVVKLRLGGR